MTTFRVSYICKHSDTNVIGQFLMRYNIWIIIVWIKKHGRYIYAILIERGITYIYLK